MVRADVAERLDPFCVGRRHEASQPPARDVFKEDALDRLALAELEHLLQRRPVDDSGHG